MSSVVNPASKFAPSATSKRSSSQGNSISDNSVQKIQAILKCSTIRITHLGQSPFFERASLQMIAAQALQKGILGFSFDGLAGKYEVTAPLSDVLQLHKHAAFEVATESTRSGFINWASGNKASEISEWVPDSVQRLLSGSISLDAAKIVASGLNSGSIARHAEQFGSHGIARILADRGLDVNAPTLQEQAAELGLLVKEPDRQRGQYFGAVVAQDHRSSLIKVNHDEAVELSISESRDTKMKIGDVLRLSFKAGVLGITVKSMAREGNARE